MQLRNELQLIHIHMLSAHDMEDISYPPFTMKLIDINYFESE